MASLSYFDEHTAWQQRVQREITVAHRFNPKSKDLNMRLLYQFVPKEIETTPPSTNRNMLPSVESSRIYAEVRGKYSRHTINLAPNQLPTVRSRVASTVNTTKNSRRSSIKVESELYENIEGKNSDELLKLLRQERLRRMIAERRLKKHEQSEKGSLN